LHLTADTSAFLVAFKDSPLLTTYPTPDMTLWILPNIAYLVTREFQSKLFNRLTYAAVFLSIAVLTIINGMFNPELDNDLPD
jgi:hypothetical protein